MMNVGKDGRGPVPGLAARICKKAGIAVAAVAAALRDELKKLPVQRPPPDTMAPSQALLRALKAAQAIQKDLGDDFLAGDHVLVAVCDDRAVSKALGVASLGVDVIRSTVKALRGSSKVDSKNAEGTYDALNTYGVDLVQQGA